MTVAEPTIVQLEVLRLIRDGINSATVPTYREICARFGWKSTNAAADVIKALQKKGLLVAPEKDAATVTRRFRMTPLGRMRLGGHLRRCELCGSEVAP